MHFALIVGHAFEYTVSSVHETTLKGYRADIFGIASCLVVLQCCWLAICSLAMTYVSGSFWCHMPLPIAPPGAETVSLEDACLLPHLEFVCIFLLVVNRV